MEASALSNSAGSALIFLIVPGSVLMAWGWRPIRPYMAVADLQEGQLARLGAPSAWSMMPSERGTPPLIVHNTPVPAQVMHSSTRRRLTPESL